MTRIPIPSFNALPIQGTLCTRCKQPGCEFRSPSLSTTTILPPFDGLATPLTLPGKAGSSRRRLGPPPILCSIKGWLSAVYSDMVDCKGRTVKCQLHCRSDPWLPLAARRPPCVPHAPEEVSGEGPSMMISRLYVRRCELQHKCMKRVSRSVI